MAAKNEDDVKWSDEFYTIKQVVQNGLPTIVKVNEGFYTENETDSFSAGDMIKLDCKKSYQKVAAVLLNSEAKKDEEGYILPGEEVMVPLGYKGKLKVLHSVNTFYNVKDLLKSFPRLVKIGKPTDVRQKMTTITLKTGALLELDRFIPGEGLICKHKNQIVVLMEGLKGVFHVVPDETQYTLQNVVDNLNLPQIVRFLDNEIEKVITDDLHGAIQNIANFSGCLKLMRVVKQEVVIGHYKPAIQGSTNSSEKYCRRALALLPLDSPVINEIDVQIPVYSEHDDYEFLCVKNFSHSYDLDIVEGGLYVEFSKTPRIHIFNDTKDQPNTDVPPPRPPRPSVNKHDRYKPKVPVRSYKKPTSPISDLPRSAGDITHRNRPKVPDKPRHILANSASESQRTKKASSTKNQTTTTTTTESTSSSDDEYEAVDKPQCVNTKSSPKASSTKNQTTTTTTTESTSSSDDEYEAVDKPQCVNTKSSPKVMPPQNVVPHTTKIIPVQGVERGGIKEINEPKDDVDEEQPTYDEIKDEDMIYEVHELEQGFENALTVKDIKGFSVMPMTFKVGLKKVQHELLKKLKRLPSSAGIKARLNLLPSKKKLQHSSEDSDDDDQNKYDYPDLSKMSIEPSTKTDVKKHISELPRFSRNSVKRKIFDKPVCKIVPSVRPTDKNNETELPLSSMSVEQVYTCFVECGLPELATKCKNEEIDGAFIWSYDDIELKRVFSLTDLHAKKVEKIKQGWRPRKD